MRIDFAVSPLGPGSSLAALARPGHVRGRAPRATSRLGREPLSVFVFTMSNSAVSSFPRRVAAPGFVSLFACAFAFASAGEFGASGRRDSSNPVPPMRGGWSADRRTLSFGRACDARPPVPGRPGPLSALHRGGFRMRTTKPAPGIGTPEPAATARAKPSCLAVGVPDLPSPRLRAAAAGRHSSLRLAGSSLEDAPP